MPSTFVFLNLVVSLRAASVWLKDLPRFPKQLQQPVYLEITMQLLLGQLVTNMRQ